MSISNDNPNFKLNKKIRYQRAITTLKLLIKNYLFKKTKKVKIYFFMDKKTFFLLQINGLPPYYFL